MVLVTLPVAIAQEPSEDAGAREPPCPGFHVMAGVGDVCPRGPGNYEVYAPDGRSLGFTHGPDPVCAECEEPLLAQGSTTPHCVSGASTEYNVVVIYARAFDDLDRYGSMAGTIRNLVGSANAMVDDAAIATGDRLAIRVKCTGGIVDVANEVLPTSRASATYATVIDDLENKGYTNGRKKHWVYYDDASACGCAGIGHRYVDESDSVSNLNNGNGQAMFAISFDSASTRTMLHELGHNLGAVQNGAPRTSGAGHCTDGRDTMCYDDGGPNSGACQPDFSCSGVCAVEVFDCNKDTYCHANPPVGSYLDTHWQACHRQTRFLQYADNVAPVMMSLSCSPDPSYAEETVTCSFWASDPNVGVYYVVDWGDGSSTTRVPSAGTVSPGTTRTATHAYLSQGERTVNVTATDSGTPPMTSAPMSDAQSVGPANLAPVVDPIACPASPAENETVTCTFVANDAQNVSYLVAWGDGSASERVPASGVVPAGAPRSASHVYTRGGTFTVWVNATDDGRPPKTGSRSLALPVTEVNTAPIMTALACPTALQRPGVPFSCSLRANDDGPFVRYLVDWGDGNASTVPGTGYVPTHAPQSASHAYTVDDRTYTVSVRATDDFSPPETSAPITALVRVQNDQSPPTLMVNDPRSGTVYFGCGASASKATGRPLFVGAGCVRAVATDPSGVARVEVLREGALLAFDALPPYEIEFDVPRADVDSTYTVRAFDVHGFARSIGFRADALAGSG